MNMLQTREKDAHTLTHYHTSTHTRTLARKRHERGRETENRTRERERERERERGKSGSKRDNQESQQYKAWATCNRYTVRMLTLRCQYVGDMHAQ